MPKKQTKPTAPWYEVKAAANEGEEAELLIYGNIGPSFWDDESVTAKQLIKDLKDIAGQDLVVRVNSVGGSVADGIAIFNALRRHDGAVRTEIDAVAYSAASLIAMAGETVSMADNGLLMIHAPMSFASGNAKEMRRMADVLDKYADAMTSAYVRDGGPGQSDIEGWLKDGDDHYFTASEALDMGLIDDTTESVDIAACLHGVNDARFHLPAAVAVAKPQPGAPKMPKEKPEAAAPGPVETKPAAKPELNVVDIEAAAEAKLLERIQARNAEIEPVFAMHINKPGVQALKDKVLADPQMTADQARAELLAVLGKDAQPIQQPGAQIAAGEDQADKRQQGMASALLSRMGVVAVDRSNPWRGLKLSDMARACLENAGMNVRGMHVEEFAPMALSPVIAAQTRSDFPVILENTLHKLVLTGFEGQPITWDRVAKIGDVSDFRAWNRLVPGLIGNLDDVDEHGAYRDKALPDAEKASVSATRKGNIISITPETLINDDIGAIQAMADGLGRVGNRTIERAFYTLLESNPTVKGAALFHADHANLAGAGAAPTIDLIDAAAVAMASQTAPGDDAEPLDINPKVALVHRSLLGNMIELVNAEYNDEATKNQRKPNKVRGIVDDIVGSVRLTSSTAWYLFADPMVAPVIEVVFLNGQRTPRVVMEESFRTSGMSWKVELPFGVGAIDYRGAYKNPGA